jgi:hypothetical protein
MAKIGTRKFPKYISVCADSTLIIVRIYSIVSIAEPFGNISNWTLGFEV